MAEDRVVRVPDDQVDGLEEWVRETDDDDLRGVGALRMEGGGRWPWHVSVWMAGLVRDEPLEGDMRRAVDGALRAVDGVADVAEGDREVWLVAGTPTGEALVQAVAAAVGALAVRAAEYRAGLTFD